MNREQFRLNFLGSKKNTFTNPQRRTIVVVNPSPKRETEAGPLSKARKSLTTKQESENMATAKQIAARKRFAAMARSGAFKKSKKSHKRRKAHNPSAATKHRVRVSSTGSKRSGYRFTLGNKSPYKSRVKSINPGRKHRRFKRRNPSASKKILGFIDLNLLTSFALGGAGFVATVKFINPQLAKLPFMAPHTDGTVNYVSKFKGVALLALSLLGVAKIKNRMVRDVLIGVGVAGAYDLVAQNIPSAGIAALNGMDYSLVGYDPMLGTDVGFADLSNLNGTDATFLGADASTIY